MNNNLMFSSKSDEYETPQWLFNDLDNIFEFDIDVCATAKNAKCDIWITKEYDGLKTSWITTGLRILNSPPTCWMNPPYSKIKDWMKKAYEEAQKGCTVVALVPARTDTKWFHEYVYDTESWTFKQEVRFLKGRLKFGDSKNSAPFPSMIVVFRKRVET